MELNSLKQASQKTTSVLILFNHHLSEKILSGGEKMFLEVSRRLELFDISLSASVPEISSNTLKKEGLTFPFFTIPCFAFEYNSYKESSLDMFMMLFVYTYRAFYCTICTPFWIKKSQADIIYSTGDFFPDTIPAAFYKILSKREIKWINLIHHIIESPFTRVAGSFLSNSGSYLMQRFSFFLIKYFADGVFVKNKEVMEQLIKMGFTKEKIVIIDNGIDLEKIEKMDADYSPPFDACYIGRLSASKGISDLITIWKIVNKTHPDATLAIIGGGSQRLEEEKREMVRKMNLQNTIKILGSLPDDEAYRIRKTSKISVSCSHEEGWGITIAESLACGIPCVVYDLPVYQEKFKGAVELVPKGDHTKFAATILVLLEKKEKRVLLASKGREIVKQFDINKVVEKEAQVIKAIELSP